MSAITTQIPIHAQTAPDRPALVFEQDRIIWRDLAISVDHLAAAIAVQVPAGAGMALHLPNGPALALLFLAVARAGREAQVLDPDWPVETTTSILAELAPAITVTADRRLTTRNAIVLDDPLMPFALVAKIWPLPTRRACLPEPAGRIPFYVGFTSGSTGRPKGYRRDHRSWVQSFAGDAIEFGIDADDVVLAPGTLTHSLFLYAMVHGLHTGATVVLCQRFRPTAIPRLVRAHGVTVLYGVPTHLRLALESAEAAEELPLYGVRWVLSSGAKWSVDSTPNLRRLFPAARFAEFYGASELSFVTVAKDDEPVPQTSVGRVFPGVRVRIRDRRGRPLPAGQIGRVFVNSPLVFSGYAGGNEEDIFRVGRELSVGDLGFLDGEGFLHLVGRESRMIVTSGKTLSPEEIERVLNGHPAITAAAVFGVPDAKRGERLIALLSTPADVRPSRAALIAHARGMLPLFKVPRRYGIISKWPRTRSGKSDFEALRRLCGQGAYEPLA